MNASSSTTAGTNTKPPKAGKEAKDGKEGKDSKDGKDSKAKDAKRAKEPAGAAGFGNVRDVTTSDPSSLDLAEITRTLAQLVADVDALRQNNAAAAALATSGRASGAQQQRSKNGRGDSLVAALNAAPGAVVALAFGATREGAAPYATVADAAELRDVDTARMARIGYAFASAPKISLIRLLIDERERTAAQLGEGAGLTTGSLYHHLRELVHAEVVQTSGRNQYALTDLGRRMTLALLALANDASRRPESGGAAG
jgi:DNA-binding HxlR family transcriptional regulator